MAKVKDLVCGMEVDTDTAAAKTTYEGKTYYFCAPGCKVEFERNPRKYVDAQEPHQGHGSHSH